MKKILIIFVCLFFLLIENVNALECNNYLTNLEIEGYSYTPNFNKYNNYYSINVPSNINSLKLNYSLGSENVKVIIKGNDPLTNEINIILNCEDEEEIYTIYVNKEKNKEVFEYLPITENKFTVKDKSITIVIIGLISLFIIYCIGYFLFKKRIKF